MQTDRCVRRLAWNIIFLQVCSAALSSTINVNEFDGDCLQLFCFCFNLLHRTYASTYFAQSSFVDLSPASTTREICVSTGRGPPQVKMTTYGRRAFQHDACSIYLERSSELYHSLRLLLDACFNMFTSCRSTSTPSAFWGHYLQLMCCVYYL